jgi:hypothetical protein
VALYIWSTCKLKFRFERMAIRLGDEYFDTADFRWTASVALEDKN